MMCPNPMNKDDKKLYKYFYKFNICLEKRTNNYDKTLQKSITRFPLMIILLIVIYIGAGFLGKTLTTSFIPIEEKGFTINSLELSSAASEEKTRKVMGKIDKILNKNLFIKKTYSISNFNILSNINI